MSKRIFNAGAIAMAALAVGILAGCSRPETVAVENPAGEETPAIDPFETLAMETDELFYKGETNAVIERFTAALASDDFTDETRPRVFSALLRFLLQTDMVEEAQKRMDGAYANGEFALARAGFGSIYFYFNEHQRTEDAEAWMSHTLEVEGLPSEMRRQGLDWSLASRLQLGDIDGACERAAQLATEFPNNAADMLNRACDRLFGDNRLDDVETILNVLVNAQPQPAQAGEVALAVKIRLLAARGEWDSARETFIATAGSIQDARLQALLRNVVRIASAAKRADIVDALCDDILHKHADKASTFSQAGRLWVENSAATAPAKLPARLSELLDLGAPASQVCTLFMRTFYSTTRLNDTLVEMIELGRRLDPLNEDEDIRTFIRTSVVDGSFILGKYDVAIEMLEKGIPGRDEQWNKMALCKVRAHKALYDEDWREAVKHVREFMALVAGAKDEDTIDPESQVRHTKNMILGRNAKRIGDILMNIPDEPAAKEAYDQARDYYAKAREECAGDAETLAIISQEEAELP